MKNAYWGVAVGESEQIMKLKVNILIKMIHRDEVPINSELKRFILFESLLGMVGWVSQVRVTKAK